jgi:hypothetical protein
MIVQVMLFDRRLRSSDLNAGGSLQMPEERPEYVVILKDVLRDDLSSNEDLEPTVTLLERNGCGLGWDRFSSLGGFLVSPDGRRDRENYQRQNCASRHRSSLGPFERRNSKRH